MQVNITGRNFPISESMRSFCQQRADRIEKFDEPVTSCELTFQRTMLTTQVDMVMKIAGATLVANAQHSDGYCAINMAFEKIERQLKRALHKPNAHRHSRHGKSQCRDGNIGEGYSHIGNAF